MFRTQTRGAGLRGPWLSHLGAPLAIACLGLGCDELVNNVPVGGCTLEDGEIKTDTILTKVCSPYAIEQSISVSEGATLTIEPGVELRFASGHWLEVGANSDGKLIAVGTPADPIIFTSATPATAAKGAWYGLYLKSHTAPGTTITNAKVRFAGQEGLGIKGCVTVTDAVDGAVTIASTSFENCEQAGLFVEGGHINLLGLRFASSDAGLRLHANNVVSVVEGYQYEGVTKNILEGGDITESGVWVAQAIPYHVDGSLGVTEDADLTLGSGLELRFDSGHWLEVGSGGAPGGLQTQGGAPVILQGTSPDTAQPGGWYGIFFRDSTKAGSRLDNVTIRHAGQEGLGVEGCVTVDSPATLSISISNSRFEKCLQSGVSATRTNAFRFETMEGNTFVDSDAGMWLNAGTVDGVMTQTYEGTPHNIIRGDDVERDATWSAQSVPYRVDDSISVRGVNSPELTILPGLTFRFQSGNWFEIGSGEPGLVSAVGTAAAPIVFESASSAGTPGGWYGFMIRDEVTAGTRFEHVRVRHAGQEGLGVEGCITIQTPAPDRVSVVNSTFEGCLQSGVAATDDEAFSFLEFTSNTFVDSDAGVWLHPNAVGRVAAGQVFMNTALNRISDGTVTESALWAAQSVPYELDGSMRVTGISSPTLTLDAGVTLQLRSGEWIEVGASEAGALHTQGTVANPVIFESRGTNSPGAWYGIFFRSETASSSLENFILRGAGQEGLGVQGGITLQSTGTDVSISGGTFDNNLQGDIYVDCDSTPALSGNTYDLGVVRETCG
ncbi:MAG: hypothetical protein HY791_30195 [Deltaproteobacteria bacterium]|nr:hypothetical protein [Deltaproteobacteria bacterium]